MYNFECPRIFIYTDMAIIKLLTLIHYPYCHCAITVEHSSSEHSAKISKVCFDVVLLSTILHALNKKKKILILLSSSATGVEDATT